MKKILLIVSDGFEEIEMVTVADVLRRADINVTVAGLESISVKGTHNITVMADCILKDVKGDFDMVVITGGYGNYQNLLASSEVESILNKYNISGKFIGAICAAPGVLAKSGVLDGKSATIYTGMDGELKNSKFVNEDVVVSGNIVTGKGPAQSLKFSLEIVKILAGEEKAKDVAIKMCVLD